jgi:hypothetical protein
LPLGELEVRIRACRILVEKLHHAELAKADFQATAREFVKERERVALVFDLVFAQSKHFMDHAPAQVWSFAQQRVAHNVQIGGSGNTRPVLSAAPPASSMSTNSSVELFSRTPV